jgi:hypothetical protein
LIVGLGSDLADDAAGDETAAAADFAGDDVSAAGPNVRVPSTL